MGGASPSCTSAEPEAILARQSPTQLASRERRKHSFLYSTSSLTHSPLANANAKDNLAMASPFGVEPVADPFAAT